MKNQLLDLYLCQEGTIRHGISGLDLEMDDDKLNGKPDSRHNARNIHVGFPNFP
jgi:hypothetical protein